VATYVALLRGINVGGNNRIRMPALKACFEDNGFRDVTTYIQSGNVIFATPDARPAQLADRIEGMLAASFDLTPAVVVRSVGQMRAIVHDAPRGFGTEPAKYRYDVIFLKAPLTARTAIKSVATKPGVDTAAAGAGVLYFSRLIGKAAQSQLGRIVTSPIYPSITIRNWNTTTKLLQMMDSSPS
jgi:uncharacterized protein (DUF1697 family)